MQLASRGLQLGLKIGLTPLPKRRISEAPAGGGCSFRDLLESRIGDGELLLTNHQLLGIILEKIVARISTAISPPKLDYACAIT